MTSQMRYAYVANRNARIALMSESLVTNDQIITKDQTMQMIVGTATAKSNMSFSF